MAIDLTDLREPIEEISAESSSSSVSDVMQTLLKIEHEGPVVHFEVKVPYVAWRTHVTEFWVDEDFFETPMGRRSYALSLLTARDVLFRHFKDARDANPGKRVAVMKPAVEMTVSMNADLKLYNVQLRTTWGLF